MPPLLPPLFIPSPQVNRSPILNQGNAEVLSLSPVERVVEMLV